MKRISLIYGLMRGVLEFQFYNYPVKEFVKILLIYLYTMSIETWLWVYSQ